MSTQAEIHKNKLELLTFMIEQLADKCNFDNEQVAMLVAGMKTLVLLDPDNCTVQQARAINQALAISTAWSTADKTCCDKVVH